MVQFNGNHAIVQFNGNHAMVQFWGIAAHRFTNS